MKNRNLFERDDPLRGAVPYILVVGVMILVYFGIVFWCAYTGREMPSKPW